ncbi:MAG: 16S rRNA (guanine(966)-N(2))-methyltransferase RsmD [Eubacterium sp.]|nr:16S rRNA (guanine(966)-N(2))-methyltransferase RsmD [Eubacterium sp.]
MRVIAGKARRLQLKTIEGKDTRPTTDRIKETLFNIISFDIPGCRFLDLFAGSGGIGIEALSRGASRAVFVENNRKAAACIQDNLVHTRLREEAELMTRDALSAIAIMNGKEEAFDIVFMDPPYGKGLEREALYALSQSSLLHRDSLVIIESDLDTDFDYVEDMGFFVDRIKTYKTNRHIFIKKAD